MTDSSAWRSSTCCPDTAARSTPTRLSGNTNAVDSDSGRFHRGIACAVAGLALIMLLGMLIGEHSGADVLVLLTAALVVVAVSFPLARHLCTIPANAPDHLPHRSGEQEAVAVTVDRYSTRWGGGWADRKKESR